jgi:hypothetical protein
MERPAARNPAGIGTQGRWPKRSPRDTAPSMMIILSHGD